MSEYTSSVPTLVYDDMRELPHRLSNPLTTFHCKTEEELFKYLDDGNKPVVVVLDHDLGGEAFGMQTARKGITRLVDMHISGELDIIIAYVVTMNPAGQKWIISELERGDIDYDIDVGGRQLGMKYPSGW